MALEKNMAASQSGIFSLQEFSDIGAPLVGGRLYTYVYGTTTHKTAYTDKAGTIPHTYTSDGIGGQYIALNARGELPSPLYLAAGSYDIALKDASGATIWTRRADPVDDTASTLDAALRTDLASASDASKGSALVGFRNGLNYVASSIGDIIKSLAVHVRAAPYHAGGIAVDNAAAISQAISDAYASGIGHVYVQGVLTCTGSITAAKHVTLLGDGKRTSVLTFTHEGDGIKSTWPINASTAVHFFVKDLGIKNTNASNTGAGLADVGGSYIGMEGCAVNGFKYGVIFDQTEIAYLEKNNFESQLAGGAGVWLVDGPQHTPGANPGFTNRISIKDNQFNEDATVYGIADDGGYIHEIEGNNFNGCLNHMRIGGVNGLSIDDNECESAAGSCITFENTSIGGAPSIGASISVKLDTNVLVPTTGQSCVTFNAGTSPVVMINNYLGNSTAPKITGLNNVNTFIDIGNIVGGGPYKSGTPTNQFSTGDKGTFTPSVTINGSSTGITYTTQVGQYTRVGDVVSYSIDITLSSKGAGTGSVRIEGMPYASKAGMTQMTPPPFCTGIVTATAVGGLITTGDTRIQLQNANVNFSSALLDTNISNTTTIRIAGQYLAT